MSEQDDTDQILESISKEMNDFMYFRKPPVPRDLYRMANAIACLVEVVRVDHERLATVTADFIQRIERIEEYIRPVRPTDPLHEDTMHNIDQRKL